MADAQTDFAKKFNEILGNKVGKPLTTEKARVTSDNNVKGFEIRAQAKKVKALNKKYSAEKAKLRAHKQEKNTRAASKAITEAEKEAFLKERTAELKSEDKPWWKDALGVVSRPLDILNRPFAGVANAMNEVAEATLAGEPVWSLGDDAAYGAWRGISGQSKDGYGDVHNTLKALGRGEGEETGFGNRIARSILNNAGVSRFSDASNALDRSFGPNNMASRTLDRGVGGAGDLAFDPTTYAGIGIANKAIKGLSKGAKETGEAAVERMAREGIEDAAKDLGKNLEVPSQVRLPSVDVSTGRTIKELSESEDVADQALARQLKDADDKILQGAKRDAKLISDYETGKITADDFYREYKKPGGVRSGGIAKIISDAQKFKSPVEQVVADIVKVRKAQIFQGTKTLGEVIRESVEDRSRLLINEVTTRSQKGKIVGGVGKDYSDAVGNLVTEKFRDDSLDSVRRSVEQFRSRLQRKKPPTTAEITKWRQTDPYFDTWWKKFEEINVNKRTSLTDIEVQKAMKAADDAVHEAIELEAKNIYATVRGVMNDQMVGVPTLRILGKDMAEFPRIGIALKNTGRSVKSIPAVDNFRKMFSFTANFPGYTSLISQKVKSLGVQKFEKFRNEVIDYIGANNITVKERTALTRSLVDNIAPSDPRMAEAFNFLKAKYDEIFDAEIEAGLRDASKTPRLADYHYTHIKNPRANDFRKFKNTRAKNIKKTEDLSGYSPDDLRALGYKVEDDAFKNLLIRQQKSIRRQTETFFLRDLATHYGIKSKMTAAEASSRNLRKLTPSQVPTWDGLKLAKGENIYIDNDIWEVFQTYKKMTKIQAGDDLNQLVRSFDWVTRKFKTWNTIYFPAYHVRNMIGDMLMGAMDGVGPVDYRRVWGAMFENRKGKVNPSTTTIRLGGMDVNFDKYVLTAYRENLTSSSFLNADLGGALSLRNRTAPAAVRRASELREDYGRITHFYRALDDEISSRLSKMKFDRNSREAAEKAFDRAYKEALEVASFRVNKFKFDYDALTPVEKKYMRRGIPFYTYIRKAAPTLIESMALQPRYLGTLNKWQTQLEDDWEGQAVPEWLRNLAYMRIPGTDFGITNDILPTGVLRSLGDNPISRMNPIIQTPIEANTGRDSFSNRQIGQEGDGAWSRLPEVLGNKFRGFTTFGNPLSDREGMIWDDNLTGAEKIARLIGIPLRKYDKEEDQAYAEMRYNLIGAIQKVSKKIEKKGYTVYLSERKDGISLRVKDKLTDEVIFESESLKEVQEFADSI